MWSVGARARDVYLGTRAFAVCHRAQAIAEQPVAKFDDALAALREWLEQTSTGLQLRLWLSGSLSRPFIVHPVPGIKTEAELRQVASTMAFQLTGLSEESKVWLDQGRLEQPRVAVAVQRADLHKLEETIHAITSHKHRIVSIRPWWSEVLRWTLRGQPDAVAVATQDCDSLTVLVGQGSAYEVATSFAPVTDRETADSALARLLLSADVGDGRALVRRLALNRASKAERATSASGDLALSVLLDIDR